MFFFISASCLAIGQDAGILGLPGLNLGFQASLASAFYPLLSYCPVSLFLILAILTNMYGCLVTVLTYIFLIRNNTEHHFVCLLGIRNSYSFW